MSSKSFLTSVFFFFLKIVQKMCLFFPSDSSRHNAGGLGGAHSRPAAGAGEMSLKYCNITQDHICVCTVFPFIISSVKHSPPAPPPLLGMGVTFILNKDLADPGVGWWCAQ